MTSRDRSSRRSSDGWSEPARSSPGPVVLVACLAVLLVVVVLLRSDRGPQNRLAVDAADPGAPAIGQARGPEPERSSNGGDAPERCRAQIAPEGVTVRWCADVGASQSAAAVSGSTVYVTARNRLVALEAATGRLRWQQPIGDALFASPAVGGGTVVVGDFSDDALLAFDSESGRRRWVGSTNASQPDASMATGWPTIADGAIYGVTRAGDLVATDLASGAERWRLPNGGHWWNPPAVHAGVVYNHVGSEVMAVHARDGRILWRTALDPLRRSVGPVAAGHGPVHVLATRHQRERFQSVSDDAVVTFDAIGGDEVDRLGVPRSPGSIMAPTVSAFTADGAHLYATLTEGAVVALDLESGDLRWRVDVGPEELHPPVLHGDTLYIAGSRRLMALDSATGASQWTLHADEWHIATQPAVDSGIVYVNTTAGFYAFAPDDSTTQR